MTKQIHTPPKPKKPMSPEILAKLRANMAKARAANPMVPGYVMPINDPVDNQNQQENQNTIKLNINPAEVRKRQTRLRLERYLDSKDGVKDFELMRKDDPSRALEFAADRVWGKPRSSDSVPQGKANTTVAVLVKVLCGSEGMAGPSAIGMDTKALTFKVQDDQLPSVVSVEEKLD